MKKLATWLLPLALLTFSTGALAQENPKEKPWILNMKKKWPDQHGAWEKAFDATAAARAAWKAFADGEWKTAGKAGWNNAELRQKRHDLFNALRNAEIAQAEWSIGWKKFEMKNELEGFEKFKAKAAAKAPAAK